MALSTAPSGGPGLPAGAQKVSLKELDTAGTTKKVDVTVLGDTERAYAAPPLLDGGDSNPTGACSASGLLSDAGPTPTTGDNPTGWVCTDAEITYEVGKYATWSANWSYYPG